MIAQVSHQITQFVGTVAPGVFARRAAADTEKTVLIEEIQDISAIIRLDAIIIIKGVDNLPLGAEI